MEKLIKFFICLFLASKTFAGTDDIKGRIELAIPELKVSSVESTPVKGIFRVKANEEIIYASEDGRFLFVQSQLLDLDKTREEWNLTEASLVKERLPLLKQLKNEDLIVFGKKEPKASVVVFTDYTCGYCKKLHQEVEKLNELGVSVKYAAFPRAGIGSSSYDKTVAIWCSNNKQDSLTKAKNGTDFNEAKCETNPVSKHYQLGRKLGVRGTPALLFEDGTMVPGYMPAEQLAQKAIQHSK